VLFRIDLVSWMSKLSSFCRHFRCFPAATNHSRAVRSPSSLFSFYDCRVDSFPRQREITVEVVLEILKVSSNEVELVEAGQIQMDDSFMSVFLPWTARDNVPSALMPLPPSRVAYHVHRDALTAGLVVPCCPRATPNHSRLYFQLMKTRPSPCL